MLSFHTLRKGTGTPLVFLHGFLGKSSDWQEVVKHLPGKTCIGVDLPGHGDSPFTENFFEDFPLFKEKIHLIGYSMGGRLAAQYALQFPERIKALTLCSSHPGLLNPEEKKERLESDQNWAKNLVNLPIDLFLSKWYDQPIFSGFRPDFSKRLEQNKEALVKTLTQYSLGKQPFLFLPNAQVLLGERDVKFHKLYRNYHLIPEAGHMIHLENPKLVAQFL